MLPKLFESSRLGELTVNSKKCFRTSGKSRINIYLVTDYEQMIEMTNLSFTLSLTTIIINTDDGIIAIEKLIDWVDWLVDWCKQCISLEY